jgi:peptidyl-tRNA hydrolase ICT1
MLKEGGLSDVTLKYPSHQFSPQLHSIILEAAKQSIPSLPSEQQQEHVKSLQRKEKARRKDEKAKRSSIKSGRNAKWGD